MARRIIKKIGGERIGSGAKMTIQAHGFGYSTHDVSTNLVTSQGFGTIVPHAQFLMPAGSRLRLKIDAMVTSAALYYQLYGSCKIQWDVFEAKMSLYNQRMRINLQDAGYTVDDVKFPLMELETRGFIDENRMTQRQVNTSSLLFMLGIAANGQNETNAANPVTRKHMAMWLLMYYQTVKEYYANKQEGFGYMIHNVTSAATVTTVEIYNEDILIGELNEGGGGFTALQITMDLRFNFTGEEPNWENINIMTENGNMALNEIFQTFTVGSNAGIWSTPKPEHIGLIIEGWEYIYEPQTGPQLVKYDLKEIDKMTMKIMAQVEEEAALIIDRTTPLPYGASFQKSGEVYAINSTQEGLCVGTYQSDINNNWLDNAKVNALTSRTKVKTDENGEFSINQLQIIQKMYNADMRVAVTDGTLADWREMTYGLKSKTETLKPVYAGGLSKEIVFNMVVSTAGTTDEPLASIASRGQLGAKHKGGYVQIDAAIDEKLVMINCKITPRIRYSQGVTWTSNLKTLNDLHQPTLDKIAYQNLLTDQVFAADTIVRADGTLITRSMGKQPAWQHYRSNVDRAAGFAADQEDYKVFGRKYEADIETPTRYIMRDATTYIDPLKFNEVFADASIEAMNFDVETDIEAKLTLVMSEEVIPGI